MKKSLIVIRGIPGSGKTTFATTLVDLYNAANNESIKVRSADDFFYERNGTDTYDFDFTLLHAAHQQCYNRVKFDLETKGFAVVANTFVKETEVNQYIKLADELDAKVTCMIVENRHGNNSIHNVPDEKIEQMKRNFWIKL